MVLAKQQRCQPYGQCHRSLRLQVWNYRDKKFFFRVTAGSRSQRCGRHYEIAIRSFAGKHAWRLPLVSARRVPSRLYHQWCLLLILPKLRKSSATNFTRTHSHGQGKGIRGNDGETRWVLLVLLWHMAGWNLHYKVDFGSAMLMKVQLNDLVK